MEEDLYAVSMDAVLKGDVASAVSMAEESVRRHDGSDDQVLRGLRSGMIEAASLFDSYRYSIADLSRSSCAAKAGIDALSSDRGCTRPKVLLATLQGDPHGKAKDILCMTLSSLGFDVTDLGTGIPVVSIAEVCKEKKADALVISFVMTSVMRDHRFLERKLRETGIRDEITVCVGGPPTTSEWAKAVGADIWTERLSDCLKSLLDRFM